jgi:hypothetical protein
MKQEIAEVTRAPLSTVIHLRSPVVAGHSLQEGIL